MQEKITLKQLAGLAGVSIATASRTLRTPDSVKASTRIKVQSAMHALEAKKSGIVALVIPDITNQFFPLMLTGIEEIARMQGYSLLLCNSQGLPENEDRILLDLMKLNVDGILFICIGKPSPLLVDIVTNKTIPVVFLDRDPGLKEVSVVVTDNRGGMQQAARYLASLGHRRILYIGGKEGVSTEIGRHQGFIDAFSEGVVPLDGVTEIHADYQKTKSFDLVSALIKQRRFNFTAVCTTNDNMAYGAFQAMKQAGIQIPKDVSLIGFDDLPTSELIGMTTVRQPFVEEGRTGMMQLLSSIHNPDTMGEIVVLPCALVVRDSCSIL